MKAITPFRLVGALVTMALAATPAWSAAPRDELLRLVPDDVAFCLVVQDLRGHVAALKESPFAKQFNASPVGKLIAASPELAKLRDVEQFLKQHLGTDWAQLRDDILGDAVVFAYRPGPPGKPEEEQGIFLVRAGNEKALANLVDRFNKAQQTFGELKKLEERQHNGVTYHCRIERNQPPGYYLLRGPVLAFTQQEAMLKRVIGLDQQARPADAEAPPVARQIRQLEADKALAAVWINPRAFDAELQQKMKAAQGGEATSLKALYGYWQALESVVLSLAVQQDLQVSLAARVKPEGLSPAARKLLSEGSQRSELWNAFPPDAMFATAGRIDVAALTELIGEFLDDEARKAIRESLDRSAGPALAKTLRDLIASLGPDVGMYVAAPSAGDKNWFPEGVWAIRIRPAASGKPVERTLMDALNAFANLAVLDHNSKNEDRLELKTVQQEKVEVKYFVNDKFPPGLQPAYALKDGYLIVASSPEVLRRFRIAAAPPPEASEMPLARWSLTSLRSYLKNHREPLIVASAAKDNISKEEAARRLEGLAAGLQFVDAVELTQKPTPGQVILTLRLKPNQPLRK
jgi:hypothetical protein